MRNEKLTYIRPEQEIIIFDCCDIFTLTTSDQYDPEKETDIPSIDDIIGGQQ